MRWTVAATSCTLRPARPSNVVEIVPVDPPPPYTPSLGMFGAVPELGLRREKTVRGGTACGPLKNCPPRRRLMTDLSISRHDSGLPNHRSYVFAANIDPSFPAPAADTAERRENSNNAPQSSFRIVPIPRFLITANCCCCGTSPDRKSHRTPSYCHPSLQS